MQLIPIMPDMADETGCIVCDAWRRKVLQVQEGVRILAEGVDSRFDIQTLLCETCGLVFTDPQPDDALLERFYATQFRDLFADGAVARTPGEGSRQDQLAWLRARLGDLAGRRILEIGCYDGYFLHLLAEQGASCVGIEPSGRAAAFGRSHWGVEIITGGFEAVQLPDGEFDIVALSHVAEHLRDPGEALRFAHRVLGPGGKLFVEVPNVLAPRIEHAVNFFTFDHLYNFSPRTLSRLAERCGFRTACIDTDFPFPAFRLLAGRVPTLPGEERIRSADPIAVEESRREVSRYIEGRREFVANLERRVAERLERWQADRTRVAIYGAGDHTEHLLAVTDLGRADIIAIVDGDSAKWGTKLFDVPVVAPERLPEIGVGAVVISSYDFQDEMRANVERICQPLPELLVLYERTDAFSSFRSPRRAGGAPAAGALASA